jgi:hypothetical protein
VFALNARGEHKVRPNKKLLFDCELVLAVIPAAAPAPGIIREGTIQVIAAPAPALVLVFQ